MTHELTIGEKVEEAMDLLQSALLDTLGKEYVKGSVAIDYNRAVSAALKPLIALRARKVK